MSPFEISPESFQEEVNGSEVPVAVDFFTCWCGPCKMLEPRLSQLAHDYEGKVKILSIDAEKAASIAKELDIRGVPTVVFFKGGEEAERIVGLAPYEEFAGRIESLIHTETE